MKLCPYCGARLNDNAAFCVECGQKLGSDNASAQSAPVYTRSASVPAGDTSIGTWVVTLLLCGIPVVNLICLIVWAVSSSPENRSRRNWAIALFIWALIDIAVIVLLALITGFSLIGLLGSLY